MVVVPVDGSENALRALDYLRVVFGSKYKLKVVLFYLLPSLPQILIEESTTSDEMARKFTELEKKNSAMAQLILSEGKKRLLDKGFKEQAVETIFHSKRDLKRFMPNSLLEEFPEFRKLWKHKAGEVVAPYLKRAKEVLIKAGLKENQVSIKLVEGSESAGMDILKEIENSDAGTVILGKRGCSDVKDYSMGSVAKKVLYQASDMTVCIVP